jgi:hypothetical protein
MEKQESPRTEGDVRESPKVLEKEKHFYFYKPMITRVTI